MTMMMHYFPRLPTRLSPRLACTIFRPLVGRRILSWVDFDLHPANVSAAEALGIAVILFVDACCLLPVARIQKEPVLLAEESPSWSISIDNKICF
jgi:hypothetical protein